MEEVSWRRRVDFYDDALTLYDFIQQGRDFYKGDGRYVVVCLLFKGEEKEENKEKKWKKQNGLKNIREIPFSGVVEC